MHLDCVFLTEFIQKGLYFIDKYVLEHDIKDNNIEKFLNYF